MKSDDTRAGGFGRIYWRSEKVSSTPLPALEPGSVDDATFRLLADAMPTLCWIANGDGYIVWYNRRWHEYCGTTAEEMEGWGWRSAHDPDVLPSVLERWTAAIASGEPFEMTFPLRGADGVFRPFLTRIQPVRDAGGRVARWFGVNTEISDQVEAETALRVERDRSRDVLEGMNEGFVLLDRDFRVVRVNAYALRVERRPASAIVGRTHWEAWPGTEESELGRLYKQAMAKRVPVALEHRYRFPDGRERWFEMRAYPSGDGLALFYRDVTDRKNAEAATIESERRLRLVVDGATNYAILTVDPDRRITSWSKGAALIFGHTAEEAIGAPTDLIFTPEDRAADQPSVELEIARREGCAPDERWHLRKDGGRVFMNGSVHPLPRDAGGREQGFIKIARDETEQRRAADALAESEARYRDLFEALDAGFCIVEMKFDEALKPIDYRLAEINPAFERQTGLSGAAGKWVSEAAPGLERHWFEIYGAVALTGEAVRFENYAEPFGRWYDVHAFRTGAPERRRVAILFNDVTERRTVEDRLRELNATLETRVADALAERKLWADVFASSDALIAALDKELRFLALNDSYADEFERIYGVRPKVGDRLPDLLATPEHRDAATAIWDRALRGEEFVATEAFGDAARDRPYYELRFNTLRDRQGAIVGAFQYAVDITERLRKEAQLTQAHEALRQSQKMEAMGQLTGGVAHDFNNLLTPIVGSLDMLQRRGLGGERERRLVDGAMQSAERAKMLVQRLLAFARRQPLQPTAVDLGALVGGMAGLIGSTLGPKIDVRVELADDLPAAKADPNQLEMAILNLGVNARDAMPEGGVLTISAVRESVRAGHRSGLRLGHYVRLSVSDTGVGMDEATRARAVEPFFSTKGVGKGTGLGLSMVHGLAAQLGGGLFIASEPGRGATVELWLPISVEPIDGTGAGRADPPPIAVRGRALLVDDEELVRMSVADMLIELGFEVVEAGSAEDAMRRIREGAGLDLLITDHLMPGMNGADLARAARALRPNLPVLIVSGYAEVEGLAPDLPRLTKPFRSAELADRLASLIPVSGRVA